MNCDLPFSYSSKPKSNKHHLIVQTPNFEPKFTPSSGKLILDYNGSILEISVEFPTVSVYYFTYEGSYKRFYTLEYKIPWEQIVGTVLQDHLCNLVSIANNQLVGYLREGGLVC